MFFRNLTFYRFPEGTARPLIDLGPHLEDCRLRPVGALEMSARGFVPPLGQECDSLVHATRSCRWITVGGEDKILPSAVVNEMAAKRAREMEERDGHRLGGRARKRLKDEILHELLPKAFVRPSRTSATVDLEQCFIAVDSTSRRTAESVVGELRHALGSFPALPLNAEVAPRAVLTGWLTGEALPEGLELGDECELKDGMDRGAAVRCTRQELSAQEITEHLAAGKQCTRLALTLDGCISFVLGEDLVVRKLRFLEGAIDALENEERDSVLAELDARYALMTGEIGRLFKLIESSFQLSRMEG